MENNQKIFFSVGNIYKVKGFNVSNSAVKRKFLDMGITSGTIFTVKKISPFGDRLVIFIRGYQLCVNKKNLEMVNFEQIKNN